MQKISDKSGFTLVECVVTLFIITVALWGTITGFLKINSLVEGIENIAIVDKYIAGKMEEIRSTNFGDISEEEGKEIPGAVVGGETITMSTIILNESDGSLSPVPIWVEDKPDPITIEDTKEIKISANWTPHAYKKPITRAIAFYVYKKGINRRP